MTANFALSSKTHFWKLFYIHPYIMWIFPLKYKCHEGMKPKQSAKFKYKMFSESGTAKFTPLKMYNGLLVFISQIGKYYQQCIMISNGERAHCTSSLFDAHQILSSPQAPLTCTWNLKKKSFFLHFMMIMWYLGSFGLLCPTVPNRDDQFSHTEH